MIAYINENLSVRNKKNHQTYQYTISANEIGTMTILGLCRVTGMPIRDALDFAEENGAFIESYQGTLYFQTKGETERFIQLINK